ncbi:MAG: amidohydrolase [Caulobacteraceae bacterium]|nr:amidohydrolase [Caulobacteraceae bacterium]
MWRSCKLISDDSHFEANPNLWRDFIAPEFRQYAPQVVKMPNGGDGWKLWGVEAPLALGLNLASGFGFRNIRPSGVSYSDPDIAGVGDGAQRLREMDRDGVDAEVIYGPVAALGTRYGNLPPEAALAVTRGYNDYLSKAYTAADPTRLLGLAVLPNTSLEDNIAEMMRVKDMPGIYGVSLQMWPSGKPIPTPEDDRFWKAAIDNDVPLTTHFAFGGGYEAEEAAKAKGSYGESGLKVNYCPINRLLCRVSAGSAGVVNVGFNMIQLITFGVLDRFPSLRISYAEVGAAWAPAFAEAADSNYERHRYWSKVELQHPPSHYIKRNFLFGMQDDFLAVRRLIDEIGVDNITWGTDFPHVASNWPNTRELLDGMFDGVPTEVARKIVGGNLARHLRIEPEAVHVAKAA